MFNERTEVSGIQMDCHVHTCYSPDSKMSLDNLIRACLANNIDCVAITDHNTIGGAHKLKGMAPFKVIVGEEIKTTAGEITGYFLQEEIPPSLSPEETVRRIKDQGGLVCIPHPFDRWRASALRENIYRVIEFIDFIEVFNGRNIFLGDNGRAHDFAVKYRLPMCTGSDAHTPGEVGSCRTVMKNFHTPGEFLANLTGAHLVCKRSPIKVNLFTSFHKVQKRLSALWDKDRQI